MTSNRGIVTDDEYLIHGIKFIIVLSLQIPATILSLFIFVFFITNRIHLRKLQNQALLALFIVNFIQLSFNIPILVHYLRLSRISPATSTYCKLWMYVEFTLDAASALTMAIICIQRHILIFQPNMLRTRLKCYVFYYIPLMLGVVYPMGFYLSTVVFYPCDDTQWNFTLNMCGDTNCYLFDNPILAIFDWTVNSGSPVVVVLLANVALIVRVIKQKHRRGQAVPWSKQRRMTLQLLSISSLYLITWLPTIVIGVMQQVHQSDYIYGIQETYTADLTYLICLLFPWICIGLIPDFSKWMLKYFRRLKRSRNTIGTVA